MPSTYGDGSCYTCGARNADREGDAHVCRRGFASGSVPEYEYQPTTTGNTCAYSACWRTNDLAKRLDDHAFCPEHRSQGFAIKGVDHTYTPGVLMPCGACGSKTDVRYALAGASTPSLCGKCQARAAASPLDRPLPWLQKCLAKMHEAHDEAAGINDVIPGYGPSFTSVMAAIRRPGEGLMDAVKRVIRERDDLLANKRWQCFCGFRSHYQAEMDAHADGCAQHPRFQLRAEIDRLKAKHEDDLDACNRAARFRNDEIAKLRTFDAAHAALREAGAAREGALATLRFRDGAWRVMTYTIPAAAPSGAVAAEDLEAAGLEPAGFHVVSGTAANNVLLVGPTSGEAQEALKAMADESTRPSAGPIAALAERCADFDSCGRALGHVQIDWCEGPVTRFDSLADACLCVKHARRRSAAKTAAYMRDTSRLRRALRAVARVPRATARVVTSPVVALGRLATAPVRFALGRGRWRYAAIAAAAGGVAGAAVYGPEALALLGAAWRLSGGPL